MAPLARTTAGASADDVGAGGRWPTPVARAVRRACFGATGSQLDAATAQGLQAWLTEQLAAPAAVDDAPRLSSATATRPPAAAGTREDTAALTSWWLRRMVTSAHPMHERIVFGWHDIFATSVRTVRSAALMLTQHRTLRAHAMGRFADLAPAMLTDPAMLVWLDGRRNTRRRPNENLAREFFELFTLGHDGGYTELDVREAARALTGWTVTADGTARLEPGRHDPGTKTVLGQTGPLGAEDVARIALARPQSANHVLGRWWAILAGPTSIPAATQARLLAAYGPSGQAAPMIRALLCDEGFAGAVGTLVVSPVEWIVGALRSLRVQLDDTTMAIVLAGLDRLGQLPFAPPDVSGWPSGQAWLTTASAQTRLDLAGRLVLRADLSPVADAPPARRLEAACWLLGIPALTARTQAATVGYASTPPQLVSALLLSPEYLCTDDPIDDLGHLRHRHRIPAPADPSVPAGRLRRRRRRCVAGRRRPRQSRHGAARREDRSAADGLADPRRGHPLRGQ